MIDNIKVRLRLGEMTEDIKCGEMVGGINSAGQYTPLAFVAPVDLEKDDIIICDTRSGQPFTVSRNGRVVWDYD